NAMLADKAIASIQGVSRPIIRGSKGSMSADRKLGINEEDVVIAITGRVSEETKLTFIKTSFGDCCNQEDTQSPHIRFVSASDRIRNIFFAYTSGSKEQTLKDAMRFLISWLLEVSDRKKFSGMVYLEDTSTPPPAKLSHGTSDLIDQSIERRSIVVATIGWNDEINNEVLKVRHKQLIDQWRTFVDRGVAVVRLAAPDKVSRDVCHTAWDTVQLIFKNNQDKKVTSRKYSRSASQGPVIDDGSMVDPQATDIIIPIVGPMGAGKSTFINYIAGENVMQIGHDPKPCTEDIQVVALTHPQRPRPRIVVIDTPGFDDRNVTVSEVLGRIAAWLSRSYPKNMRLAGIVYLHDITESRRFVSVQKNLNTFRQLIGHDAAKKFVFATTNWGNASKDFGARREAELKDRHLISMLTLGAKLGRFTDSYESGWAILDCIMSSSDGGQEQVV
ncbi:hypothetical protein H0H93_009109, partial [Arthromyces matolae]